MTGTAMTETAERTVVDRDELASIPEVLDEVRAGRMVVLVDDEDRENEGDLVIPA